MKHFNTNVDNNNVDDNANDDDTYDGKIRDKISDIRMILSRLGNTITINDRKKIKKELYEIENKKNLSDKEKEKNYHNLVELVNKLNKKEKYKYHDRDDLDYHGIRDIENLFDNVNDNDYYKPILVKSSFNESYKYYESRGDKDKKLSIEQHLVVIKPYLGDLIRLLYNFVFVIESVDLLSYQIHKTSLKRGYSYIKSPEWVAIKKAIINPKNKNDRCFEYFVAVALRHKEVKSHPERIQGNHYLFSCDYNWQGIEFLVGIKEWERFEKIMK